MNSAELEAMTTEQVRERARVVGVRGAENLRREELIALLTRADATPTGTDDAMTRSEEQLVISTELWETGRVRLRKHVVTEDVQVTVAVRREEIRLEREPVAAGGSAIVEDPDVFGPDEVFGGEDGGVIFAVTLHEERPVVSTEIVPVERVKLTKVVQTENQVISGDVRRERIELQLPDQAPTPLD